LIRIISIVHFWDCVIENIVLHRHNNNEQSVKKNKQGTKRKQARTSEHSYRKQLRKQTKKDMKYKLKNAVF